jgi:hypothetical protein
MALHNDGIEAMKVELLNALGPAADDFVVAGARR